MTTPTNAAPRGLLGGFVRRLRFPVLFVLTAAAFLVDIFLPDVIPFLDEIVLGLVAAVLAAVKKKAPEETAGNSPAP